MAALKNPQEQRKRRYTLPLHQRKKLFSVALSKELKAKQKLGSVVVRKGDKVRIMTGEFRGKEGKVERVDRTNERVFVESITRTKKDGKKVNVGVHPSNLLIMELYSSDKRRNLGSST